MTGQPGNPPRPATLDDLAALNREIAALVRAGLPLEEGLRQIAEDCRRGPGEIAARLERETTAGKSLAEAVAAQGDALPPTYRAVIEAGLKAGRLPAALEGFADSAARVAELRRIAAQAAAYPLIVFVLALVLLVSVAAITLPSYQWLDISDRLWATPLAHSQRAAWIAALVAATTVLTVAVVWWRRTASAHAVSNRLAWTRSIPGARRAAQLSGQASFAEMLAMLLSCRVPLGDALPLAANASGVAALRRAAADLSAHIAAGRPLASQLAAVRELPPLVRTALLGSVTHEGLLAGLSRAAETYRDRAASWIAQLAVLVPVIATLAVGGLVVGMYAYLLLQPYIATLNEAASWFS